MKILRTDADRHQAMISRPLGGNVIALECVNYREATIPEAGLDLKVEVRRHISIVVILKWFRGRNLPQILREAGL